MVARHPVLPVLVLAAGLRLATAIAYRPALFLSDSWAYLGAAYTEWPVGFISDRPSGYPLTLKALALLGHNLAVVTTVQHLAGLTSGVLAYTLMARLGVDRRVAAAATAVILLNAYTVALEQHVMAETFFALALMVSVFLAAAARPGAATLAASGASLAVACTLRTAGLPALPVLALFWWHVGSRRGAAAALLGFAAPLACYFALQTAEGTSVGLSRAGGWFLYGRVAPLADCGDAAVRQAGATLCRLTARAGDRNPAFFVWNPASPAQRIFGSHDNPHADRALRRFAAAVVRDRPLAYGHLVARESSYYFFPRVPVALNGYNAITFPSGRKPYLSASPLAVRLRRQYLSAVTGEVHPPAGALRQYQRFARMPHLLLAALTVAALLGLAVGRGRRWETMLLAGVALSLIVGATATTAFDLRYAVPVTPLLVCAAAVGGSSLWRRFAPSRARNSPCGPLPRSRVEAARGPRPTSSP
jgi:hypothetical protein